MFVTTVITHKVDWQPNYLEGFRDRIYEKLPVGTIRDWVKTIDIPSDSMSVGVEISNAPDFIKNLEPKWIKAQKHLDNEGNILFLSVEFRWDSVGILGLEIGPSHMENPTLPDITSKITIEKGVYLFIKPD
jgi:hypothetical protein